MSNLIDGLTGLRPYGAILSMGRKGARGAPEQKDRWHISSPEMAQRDAGGRSIDYHPPHPDFGPWHEAPADKRGSVVVELEHLRWSDSVTIARKRQKGRAPVGDGRPYCYQTGEHEAECWNYDKGHRMPRRCLGDQCPDVDGTPATCRPEVEVFGRLVWEDTRWRLPSVSMRWRSHGWRSCRSLLGVQQELDRLWSALVIQTTGRTDLVGLGLPELLRKTGAPGYMVQGLRIRLRIVEHTGAGKRYPTVVAEPVTPLGEWLRDHAERVAEARGYLEGAECAERVAIEGPSLADPERVRLALEWCQSKGRDEAAVVALVGAPVADWTDEHLTTLRERMREEGR